MRNFIIIIVSVLIGATGQVLFRKGMQVFGPVSISNIWVQLTKILLVPQIFLGFVCFGVSSIIWLVVVSRLQVSYAYPMVSLSYVFVLLASWLFLGEQISLMRVVAIGVICLGVALISRS